jgi:hypothetical protein
MTPAPVPPAANEVSPDVRMLYRVRQVCVEGSAAVG